MSDTIQDRLRAMPTVYWRATRLEAADHIDTLEAEIKRLRDELAAADEHAKRLEAVIEKMTVWEDGSIHVKGGRLG